MAQEREDGGRALPDRAAREHEHIEMEPGYTSNSQGYHTGQRYARRAPVRTPSEPSSVVSGQSGGLRRRASAPTRQENWEINLAEQLPSRQLATLGTIRMHKTLWGKAKKQRPGFQTLRIKHGTDAVDTGKIVDDLLSDPEFSRPSELQNEEIKELHTNLATKRSIKARLEQTADRQESDRHPSWFKRTRYRMAIAWKHTKDNTAEVMYSIDLWRGHLTKIEGKFGTGVASYFTFLRWLFLLNIPVFIVLFALVVIPQLLHRVSQDNPYPNSKSFTGVELITGAGWFLETELYYGTYLNHSITVIQGVPYNMPYGYLLTVAAYYFLTLIFLLYSLTRSYKKTFIDGAGMLKLRFVTKVFCGWDYTITSEAAANLKQQSVFKELQEYLSVFKKSDVHRTRSQYCGLILFRICTNLIVIGLIAGSGYLVWFISTMQSLKSEDQFLTTMALPLVISAINFILPFAFSILASFETYTNPRVELYLTMTRTITLYITTLAILIYFWFDNVDCADRKWLDKDTQCRPCWENFMGENIYRLVIVDFLVTLLITFFAELIRRLMAQFCCKSLGYPEFNIGRNTLYLIYSQALIWLGTFYSPLLCVIAILKTLIIFYVKRYSVMMNCVPSGKPWRGGRTHTIIISFLGLALVLCFVAVGYSIVVLKPSAVCGPYRNKDTSYQVISELVGQWEESAPAITVILSFITSSGFLAGVILALIIAAYYSRITAKGLNEMVNSLKNQIALEGKDKKFLLKLIQTAEPQNSSPRPVVDVPAATTPVTSYQTPSTPKSPDRTVSEKGKKYNVKGGKQFAKTTMAAVQNENGSSPRKHKKGGKPKSAESSLSPSPGDGRTDRDRNRDQDRRARDRDRKARDRDRRAGKGEKQEVYNQGYLDKSLDSAENPNSQGSNQEYNHSSQIQRPNLPYQGQHYDMYRK